MAVIIGGFVALKLSFATPFLPIITTSDAPFGLIVNSQTAILG